MPSSANPFGSNFYKKSFASTVAEKPIKVSPKVIVTPALRLWLRATFVL
jgi:hypothetical protein|tara:strand:- start:35 stop:181 length:147 start_codon:yes stop_codon:yes gene_type:complete